MLSLLFLFALFSFSTGCLPDCTPELLGDGICQEACFNLACNFDLNDCGCSPSCPESLIGNYLCNPECLLSACDWDRGDCDSECAKSGCNLRSLNDGICNKECNIETCGFDRGDCGHTGNKESQMKKDEAYLFKPEYVGKKNVRLIMPFAVYLLCFVAAWALMKKLICRPRNLISYEMAEQIVPLPSEVKELSCEAEQEKQYRYSIFKGDEIELIPYKVATIITDPQGELSI
jgi:hypothetical protein